MIADACHRLVTLETAADRRLAATVMICAIIIGIRIGMNW